MRRDFSLRLPPFSGCFFTTAGEKKKNEMGKNRRRYEHGDWLSNVRVVVSDARVPIRWSGVVVGYRAEVVGVRDYYSYGGRMVERSYEVGGVYRWGFNGQEVVGELGRSHYTARFWEYDGRLGRRWEVDPEQGKAPHWTPYRGLFDNPVWYVDPLGAFEAPPHIEVRKNADGTYTVVGGELNEDKNIYVVDASGRRTGEVIGQMRTSYSFFDEKDKPVVGARIDLRDRSGQKFFDEEIRGPVMRGELGLFEYAWNARSGGPFDFKMRGWEGNKSKVPRTHVYRGMLFEGKIASARDIGNYAAGYVTGAYGWSWQATRFAFDIYQTYSSGIWRRDKIRIEREAEVSQAAQWVGYVRGLSEHLLRLRRYKQERFEIEYRKAMSPWPSGPKW